MTTIKDVTEQKERKKKPKSLIGFLSANKINDYNRVGKKEKKKKKENSTELQKSTERERFITTIKNVTEKRKTKPKSLIRFCSVN